MGPGRTAARAAHSVGGSPRGLALVGSTLWLAADAFSAPGHVGGTVTVDCASSLAAVGGIDPAINDVTSTGEPEGVIYDGLVGYRTADGTVGLTLVPDLATTLPRPTDGGLTYTFTLRSGITYSTGAVVRAADIRRGLQRALTLGSFTAGYYTGILGAPNCQSHPTSCDLSRGERTDEAPRRVSFHLTAPDPGLLDKLTRFVYPTPTKARLRPMLGLKRLASARTVAAGHAFVQNLRRGQYAITADLPVQDRVRVAFDNLPLSL